MERHSISRLFILYTFHSAQSKFYTNIISLENFTRFYIVTFVVSHHTLHACVMHFITFSWLKKLYPHRHRATGGQYCAPITCRLDLTSHCIHCRVRARVQSICPQIKLTYRCRAYRIHTRCTTEVGLFNSARGWSVLTRCLRENEFRSVKQCRLWCCLPMFSPPRP